MRRIKALILLILCFNLSMEASRIYKTSTPGWVKEIPFSTENIDEDNGGYQYLLLDFQDNLVNQSIFRHFVVSILTSEGIQSMSDIEVTYDPSYQHLVFHSLRIIRDGKILERLSTTDIKLIQRETKHERSIYDGSLSAIINLDDVRELDIIEYSYSITGFNPIKKGRYSREYSHQFSVPVNHIVNRIVSSSDNPLKYKLIEGAREPEIFESGNEIAYVWNIRIPELFFYDDNTPDWFESGEGISLSTYKSWQEVVELTLPLYKINSGLVAGIVIPNVSGLSGEDRIMELITLVQDEIRYLGLESGIGAYKPHSPVQVYNQRYGDCKDKSLLLVALLRQEGITAYPLLVNTSLEHMVDESLPGYNAFNHCVVNLQYKGKDYYVDPTLTNQGGKLDNLYFPGYKTGLLIKKGETGLTELPFNSNGALDIEEDIYVQAIGGKAKFEIVSRYSGSRADNIREYFRSSSRKSIQKEYLDYYSALYPGVKVTEDVEIIDSTRSTSNQVITKEYYEIDNFWLDSDDGSYIYCEAYPLVLESQIDYPDTPDRTMPYYTGEPQSFSQITRIHLPESWGVEPSEVSINGDGFSYQNKISYGDQIVIISHNYHLSHEFIEAGSVPKFLEKHDKIMKELSYYLTYQDLSGFTLSWISILLAILLVGGGGFLALRIYKGYDPEPFLEAKNLPIGSWLVLPAIGFILTPIIIIYQMISEGSFNQNTWIGLLNVESGNAISLTALGAMEFVFNILSVILIGLILILFFQKRTSAPMIITIYLVASVVFAVVDLIWVETATPGLLTGEEKQDLYQNITRGVISGAIWIPYFTKSQRAKDTFSRQYCKGG